MLILNFAEQVNFINFLTKLIHTLANTHARVHEIEREKMSKHTNPIIIDLCMKNEDRSNGKSLKRNEKNKKLKRAYSTDNVSLYMNMNIF